MTVSRYLPLAVAALLVSGCGAGGGSGSSTASANSPYRAYQSEVYSSPQNWLCRPDLPAGSDACQGNIDALFVEADGTARSEPFVAAAAAEVDCFYIYPTTSPDPGVNSDRVPDQQEIQTALLQAGRYGSVCRLFAPMYRQRTLTVLALDSAVDPAVSDEQEAAAGEIAYSDVVDAFKHYIANDNRGRGFFILGHSQGSRLASRLIAEEVERSPYLHDRLISAHIPGFPVEVPEGKDVGGTFKITPACRAVDQLGCVINYSAYRAGDAQLADPRFGVASDPTRLAMCVNPAALQGGKAALDPYLPFVLPPVFQALLIPRGSGGPYANPAQNVTAAVSTPFYNVPGQLSGECKVSENRVSYLEISIDADPADPRADDYPGEFIGGTNWGLHLADVNVAQGDLVRIAGEQAKRWLQK